MKSKNLSNILTIQFLIPVTSALRTTNENNEKTKNWFFSDSTKDDENNDIDKQQNIIVKKFKDRFKQPASSRIYSLEKNVLTALSEHHEICKNFF